MSNFPLKIFYAFKFAHSNKLAPRLRYDWQVSYEKFRTQIESHLNHNKSTFPYLEFDCTIAVDIDTSQQIASNIKTNIRSFLIRILSVYKIF